MRCDKMHAQIAVKTCLANQKKLSGDVFTRSTSLRYPGCRDCQTGELARAGKLNDDDLKALLDGYHNRMHPPADLVAQAQTRSTEAAQTQEETVMEEEKQAASKANQDGPKVCTKCRKPKPIERFSRVKKGEEKRKSICMDCEAAYQRDRKKRIREREEQRMRQEAQLIEDHAEAARKRMEEQAEPTPARESTAPTRPHEEPDPSDPNDLTGLVTGKILENRLLLDFSCYPEVLKEIKRIAHHEERSPEVQARYMLKRLLQGGGIDEAGAVEARCPVPLPHYDQMFIDGIFPRVRDLDRRSANG